MVQPRCTECTVLETAPIGQTESGASFFVLRLSSPGWDEWKPGQFVMLRPQAWGLDTVLGRPFSICDFDDGSLTIFFQVVGRGTRKLAEVKPGEIVVVWGPTGTGFSVEPDKPTLLLAGGIGLAPFVGYARRHPNPGNLAGLFGHRPPQDCYPDIPEVADFESMREQNRDDLTAFIARLEERIADYRDGLVLACGPTPFLKSVQTFAAKHGVRAELSLENRMACGTGACLCCVTGVEKNGVVSKEQVCTKGPVFDAASVHLEEE